MMRTGALPLLLVIPQALSSQTIVGHVSEVATDQPIPEAAITIVDAANKRLALAISDSVGVFSLDAPQLEDARIRVQRLGYAATESVALTLSPGDTLRLEIHLRPEPVLLDSITAAATPVRFDHNVRGFARRMQGGFGRYLGPAQLANMRVNSVMDVLIPISGGALLWENNGRLLYGRSRIGGLCTPRVFVDGTMIQETVESGGRLGRGSIPMVPVDANVPASNIRAVEFYRRPREAPPQYQAILSVETRTRTMGGNSGSSGGECPIILIWTDWGFGWETP